MCTCPSWGNRPSLRMGASVQARSSRAIALVAYLAVRAGAAAVPAADRGDVLAGVDGRPGADQPAPRAAPLRQILGRESSLVVTSRDLCWCDTGSCRVDLRAFTIARSAALAAAAAGDDAGVLVHAATAVECYKGELLPGVYDGQASSSMSTPLASVEMNVGQPPRIPIGVGDAGRQ